MCHLEKWLCHLTNFIKKTPKNSGLIKKPPNIKKYTILVFVKKPKKPQIMGHKCTKGFAK
jgi:hypothetical protein